MKKFLSVLFILFCTCAATAQNLPTKWNCRTKGLEGEEKACVHLFDQFVGSGWADMIDSEEYPPVWFRIDVIVQETPERKVLTMNIMIMMAYPAKFGNLLIAVYTQAMSVGVEGVDEPALYKVVVDDVIRDVGDWAKSTGDFIDFCPNSGLEWYKDQDELSETTS